MFSNDNRNNKTNDTNKIQYKYRINNIGPFFRMQHVFRNKEEREREREPHLGDFSATRDYDLSR